MPEDELAPESPTFGILGPFEAIAGGRALPLGGRQQRAVLAMLACEVGHLVSVDRLIEGVWGDAAPAGAVTSVKTYVFHLREMLEPRRPRGSPATILETVPGGYRLAIDPRRVDATRFEEQLGSGDAAMARGKTDEALAAYDHGLALWRGDVLADLTDCPFVAPVRARLDEQRLAALQSRIRAELDLGRHLAVVPELRTLIAEHPLREEFHAQLILALYRSGRQSDALAAYRKLRAVLVEELGIEPSPPLRELHSRVLAQDAALAWQSTRSVPATTARPKEGPTQGPTGRPLSLPPPAHHRRTRLGALAVTMAVAAELLGGATIQAWNAPAVAEMLPANSVSVLDDAGSVLASIPVGTNPTAVAASRDAIWVVNAGDDTVSRVNPSTHSVQQVIGVGHDPRALAVTGDDLWVTNFADGTVSRINVIADQVVDTIQVGSNPYAVAAGPAGLWVANSGDNTIQRINTSSGVPGHPIDVGDGPDGLAVDETSIWVANGRAGTVMHIDSRTGAPMSPPIPVGSGPSGMARVGAQLWVANELSQNVSRIDVATGRATSIDVGDGPTSVAFLAGAIWVAEKYSGELLRIDPDTGVRSRIRVGAPAHGLVEADGHMWVASGAFPSTGHRGGTLRVTSAALPGKYSGIDPARVYDRTTYHAERVVYDGLLAYHYASADPQVLVPDLAAQVPTPLDGGRTYVFNLRPGIKYSTGTEVLASDFVRGVYRALRPRAARPDFYAGIVGGEACIAHPSSCDLSKGVVADDDAGRVTFHLTAPDPQFLPKLTILAVPAPPGTPLGRITSPLPGTGPYRISAYRRGSEFALSRNAYFREWSAPAQPNGFLEAITWSRVADTRTGADAVRRDQADLAELTPLFAHPGQSGSLVEALRIAAPSLVHGSVTQTTEFGVLDSATPPFDNLLARRAVNYAVDRRETVRLMGGELVASATCQLVPRSMPSYRPYCPYTRGLPDGEYHGPDLRKARQLVAASGTAGMRVTVTDLVDDYNPPLDAYLAGVLRRLGYHVTLRSLRDSPRNEHWFYGPRNGIQVASGGWIADFPLPANFYELIACPQFKGGYPINHCDPDLDRRAEAAAAAMQTDPGAALREWTEIDRAATDQAPLVPVTNDVNWWVTSERVGNYQTGSQSIGPLLSQLWVR
jgi:YVTN family beta-propeller protein